MKTNRFLCILLIVILCLCNISTVFAESNTFRAYNGNNVFEKSFFIHNYTTEDRLKRIDEIQVGDLVWSENIETGEIALKEVTEVFEREDNVLVHLGVNGEVINTTSLHPFYVIGKGWTEAIEVEIGDKVLLQDGTTSEITNKTVEELKEPVKVYNFTVNEFHTYFVGNNSILVHNSCERHHIASDKSKKTKYTEEYKKIFDKGDVSFNDPHNIIELEGHKGRHTNNYKNNVIIY